MISRAASLLALCTALACAPPTSELVVVVDTDLGVPGQLDAVVLTAVLASGAQLQTTTVDLTQPGAPSLPLTLGLVAARDDLGAVAVTARGLSHGTEVVRRSANAAFVRGQVLTLALPLTRRCLMVTCADPAQTCDDATGACGNADVVTLPPWTGTAPRIAAAPTPCGALGGACCPSAVACGDPGATCSGAVCACSGCHRLQDVTFESGALTNGTDGADAVTGTVALEARAPLFGAYAATVACDAGSYATVDFAAATDLYLSFYLRLASLPPADARIVLVSSAAVTPTMALGGLFVGGSNTGAAAGRLELATMPGVARMSAATPLEAGVTYRVGLHQRAGDGGSGSGLIEGFFARADDGHGGAFGAPFASAATTTFAQGATLASFGNTVACVAGTLDDLRFDAAAMPGPSLTF